MRKLILAAIAVVIGGSAMAQNAYELYQYSNTSTRNNSLSARAAAMGGAFTSLGADVSSAAVNPAGLGLYKRSEVSVTPSMTFSGVTTSTSTYETKTSSDRFNLNNLYAMFNLISSDTRLVRGLTIGFGYSLEGSQNYTSTANAGGSNWSIVDMFANQLTAAGINPSNLLVDMDNPYGAFHITSPGLWGAVDAFNNGAFESTTDAPYSYRPDQNSFNQGDEFEATKVSTFTSRNENFNFSIGTKLGNYVNIGMALGVTDYSARYHDKYSEYAMQKNQGNYNGLDQWEGRSIDGTAFDFKVGTIVEPLTGLRVGLSYHAPRVTTLYDTYYVDQEVYYAGESSLYTQSAIYENWYKLKSPSKLLAGVSYVINKIGIISLDWERAYYNKMSINGLGSDNEPINSEVSNYYKPQDVIRIGAEIYVGGGIFLRGGYAQSSSPLKSEALVDSKFDESFRNISAGFGWTSRSFYVDLAYVNSKVNMLPYTLYNAEFAPIAYASKSDNIVSLTAGFRF